MSKSSADQGVPVSVKIRERVLASKQRFHANDNIAEFIQPGELEALLDEVEDKMKAVLESLVIDTTNDHNTADTAKRQEDLGLPACLLVPDLIRAPLARLLKRAAPRLKVLGHSEIPETHSIRIGSVIGQRQGHFGQLGSAT